YRLSSWAVASITCRGGMRAQLTGNLVMSQPPTQLVVPQPPTQLQRGIFPTTSIATNTNMEVEVEAVRQGWIPRPTRSSRFELMLRLLAIMAPVLQNPWSSQIVIH